MMCQVNSVDERDLSVEGHCVAPTMTLRSWQSHLSA